MRYLKNGATYICRVVKLKGTEIEAHNLRDVYFNVVVNDLVSAEIIKEKEDA